MSETVHILLADDEPSPREFMARLLEGETGYTVLSAGSGEEAIRLAGEFRPAVVITDLYMPGTGGLGLCRHIRATPELEGTMVMMLSAGHSVSERIEAFEAGADEYVVKPVNGDELISRVRALLRVRILRDELERDNRELERLNAVLSENLAALVRLLVHIISLRVPDAGTRSERAGAMARWMGERLGVPAPSLEMLEMAARIHEIGKGTLPDGLLRKQPSGLTVEERETLARFPLFGESIVAAVPQLREGGLYIRHQLENYDGSGLPDRLMRDEIPMPSRILRAINLIEQLSADPSLAPADITLRVREAQGTLLSPRVAQVAAEYLAVIADPHWLEGKRQIQVEEMREGMVIANDLCTANGVKLVAAGTKLSARQVERILAHNFSDPISHGIYIAA
ncbi:MAG TPA: HD domain-containing phosphohydrolase [Bacteroidota bacterium]|nr:HD domain-containing phosphohydrolase [Bacteroidota bacterium]